MLTKFYRRYIFLRTVESARAKRRDTESGQAAFFILVSGGVSAPAIESRRHEMFADLDCEQIGVEFQPGESEWSAFIPDHELQFRLQYHIMLQGRSFTREQSSGSKGPE